MEGVGKQLDQYKSLYKDDFVLFFVVVYFGQHPAMLQG